MIFIDNLNKIVLGYLSLWTDSTVEENKYASEIVLYTT